MNYLSIFGSCLSLFTISAYDLNLKAPHMFTSPAASQHTSCGFTKQMLAYFAEVATSTEAVGTKRRFGGFHRYATNRRGRGNQLSAPRHAVLLSKSALPPHIGWLKQCLILRLITAVTSTGPSCSRRLKPLYVRSRAVQAISPWHWPWLASS